MGNTGSQLSQNCPDHPGSRLPTTCTEHQTLQCVKAVLRYALRTQWGNETKITMDNSAGSLQWAATPLTLRNTGQL
jgi:hypothetical protein